VLIVPVLKKDGSVHICGDCWLIVTQVAKLRLRTPLAGSKIFTELDLAHAYKQVELEKDSRKFVTLNTHKGVYQVILWSGIGSSTVPKENRESATRTKTCQCSS